MAEGGYPEKLKAYAERYGSSERTVKRWVATGKAAGDRCPLDDGEAMAGWWQRNFKQKVPDEILRAAPLLELPVAKAVARPDEMEVPTGPAVPGKRDLPVAAEELGTEQRLRRLEEMEVRLSRTAAEPGQTKAWLDTVQRIGAVEQSLREELVQQGLLVPKQMVEDALRGLHGPIEREVRLHYAAMCELLGLPATPEMEARWNRVCDETFRGFKGGLLAS